MDEGKTTSDECFVEDKSDIDQNESKEMVDESRVESVDEARVERADEVRVERADEARVERADEAKVESADEARVENDELKNEKDKSLVKNNATTVEKDSYKVEKDESTEKLDAMDKLLDSALQDFEKRAPKKSKKKLPESSKSPEDDLLNMFHKAGLFLLSTVIIYKVCFNSF
jgi:hypothetical protein